MASKLIILFALALALGVVCHSLPVFNYGTADPIVELTVRDLLVNAESKPSIPRNLIEKFDYLARCYNGTFTELKHANERVGRDTEEEPLYKYCHQNRDILLDSYWYNMGKNMGAALIMSVEPIRYFDEYVKNKGLEGLSLKDQLIDYRIRWTYKVERMRHSKYCKEMIDLVDDEFGQWGVRVQHVIDFFETRTKLPIGRAIGLCRIAKDL